MSSQAKLFSSLKKQWKVFLICVVISTVFWSLMTLSESYKNEFLVELKYEGFNNNERVMLNRPPSFMPIEIEASGLELMLKNLGFKNQRITLNADDFNSYQINSKQVHYWIPRYNENVFINEIKGDIRITKYKIDTIKVITDELISKKVKIIPEVPLLFDKESYTTSPPVFSPDSILVVGAKSVLKNIQNHKVKLDTIRLQLNDFNETINIPKQNKFKSFKPKVTNLHIGLNPISQYVLSVPVKCKNCPENTDLKLFPSNIEVSFLCSDQQYSKIHPGLFEVTVSYNDIKNQKEKLDVSINKIPKSIKEVKVFPASIEYIYRN